MDDLRPGELAAAGTGGGLLLGYGYAVGEMPEPTPEQHAALIAQSRTLGRYLTEAEVASIVCPEGGKDAHV